MNLLTVNLSHSMTAANRKALARDNATLSKQAALDAEVAKVIRESTALAKADEQIDIMRTLGLDYKVSEAETVRAAQDRWSHLPQERIFTLDAIKATCIRYGLRFLPSNVYKGALDEGIPAAVEALKAANRGALPDVQYSVFNQSTFKWEYHSFFIAAPASSFVLSARPKDPLLFCALGDDRFYLIHQWGGDLSRLRAIGTAISRFRWVPTTLALVAIAVVMARTHGGSIVDYVVSLFVTVCAVALGNMLIGLTMLPFIDDMPEPSAGFSFLFGSPASKWNSRFTN